MRKNNTLMICLVLFATALTASAQHQYETMFPYEFKRQKRNERVLKIERNDKTNAFTYTKDSIIEGTNIFKTEKKSKLFKTEYYLVNQTTKDTIATYNKQFTKIKVQDLGNLTKVKRKGSGYNVIYVNSQGEEVGKGRHARFERLNYIELDCSDERISTVLFLSTLKDLRVKEQNIMAAALSVIIII